MSVSGPLAFAAPWLLPALLAVPVVWWLLRLTPPPPRTQRFPSLFLLQTLTTQEETPARTPPWLLLLRAGVLVVLVLGLAHPVLYPPQGQDDAGLMTDSGRRPLLLVVDDDWSAAAGWPKRLAGLETRLARAERAGRPVFLAATSPDPAPPPANPSSNLPVTASVTGPLNAAEAKRQLQGWQPHPWPAERGALVAQLARLKEKPPWTGPPSPWTGPIDTLWVSNGLTDANAVPLAHMLMSLGKVEVALPEPSELPVVLTLPSNQQTPPAPESAPLAQLHRISSEAPLEVEVWAMAGDGRLLGLSSVHFDSGDTKAAVTFDLPADLKPSIARIMVAGTPTAASVLLLDERSRRRAVGLVTNRQEDMGAPLLSERHYLERALSLVGDVRQEALPDLLRARLALLILPDDVLLPREEREQLAAWVERGGVLVRFAGPHLAQTTPEAGTVPTAALEGQGDSLLPVPLRPGSRTLGGALSWTEPQTLAPFPANTPFAGLAVPADVTVTRQVLADPQADLSGHTWALLKDGTPLVTARRLGRGQIVLFHSGAAPDWSSLPLSGLLVDLLGRLMVLGTGTSGDPGTAPLPPQETLDGFARLGDPPPTVLPLAPGDLAAGTVDARHPPGLYGGNLGRFALNLGPRVRAGLKPLASALPSGVHLVALEPRVLETDLQPLVLALGFLLLLTDTLAALWLRGLLHRARRPSRTASLSCLVPLLLAPTLLVGTAVADVPVEITRMAASQTVLAYVRSGDAGLDDLSRRGLDTLALALHRRTAVEVAASTGVDPDQDDLSLFPLLYWPVPAHPHPLTPQGIARVNLFLGLGGTILFDTRTPVRSAGTVALATLTRGLDIPALTPIPPDHVLGRAFYLLTEFPGRWAGGEVWVEQAEDRRRDGVSSVITGSADWAAAWATDADGRPLFPVVPGGERQREQAIRFGINLVLYALTGNYKADQVHVPAILERLKP